MENSRLELAGSSAGDFTLGDEDEEDFQLPELGLSQPDQATAPPQHAVAGPVPDATAAAELPAHTSPAPCTPGPAGAAGRPTTSGPSNADAPPSPAADASVEAAAAAPAGPPTDEQPNGAHASPATPAPQPSREAPDNGLRAGPTPAASDALAPRGSGGSGSSGSAVPASMLPSSPLVALPAASPGSLRGALGGPPGDAEGPAPTLAQLLAALSQNSRDIREAEQRLQDLIVRQQSLLVTGRRLQELRLLSLLPDHSLGFDQPGGRPVAGMLVFRAAMHWNVFASDPTHLLERLLEVLTGQVSGQDAAEASAKSSGSSADQRLDRFSALAYWCANLAALLVLTNRVVPMAPPAGRALPESVQHIQKRLTTFKFFKSSAAQPASQAPAAPAAAGPVAGTAPESQGGAAPESGATAEAKAFRTGVDKLLQKAYVLLRDQAKKRINPLLPGCMQSPDAPELGVNTYTLDEDSGPASPKEKLSAPYFCWEALQAALHECVRVLQQQNVPPPLVRCLVRQLLAFINVQMFNQMLLRPECCSASNAKFLLSGIKTLDSWLVGTGGPVAASDAWAELKHVRQAAQFLVLDNKASLNLSDIRQDICPALTTQQCYRLATTFYDDAAQGGDRVSGEVLEGMKRAQSSGGGAGVTSNGGLIVTFLLDEDVGMPFVSSGLVTAPAMLAMDNTSLLAGVPLPAALRGADCPPEVFGFLEASLTSGVAAAPGKA